jgi:hypothetical protein
MVNFCEWKGKLATEKSAFCRLGTKFRTEKHGAAQSQAFVLCAIQSALDDGSSNWILFKT